VRALEGGPLLLRPTLSCCLVWCGTTSTSTSSTLWLRLLLLPFQVRVLFVARLAVQRHVLCGRQTLMLPVYCQVMSQFLSAFSQPCMAGVEQQAKSRAALVCGMCLSTLASCFCDIQKLHVPKFCRSLLSTKVSPQVCLQEMRLCLLNVKSL
jgi:hypothetical protein